jgi:hypothetical protein
MRISLIEIKLIDEYLNAQLSVAQEIEFEDRIAKDNAFKINVFLQRKVMQLISLYHRDVVRKESKEIHDRLMNDPANIPYQEKINNLFKN